mmetsp:Transcript_9728/g.23480  ORF Transcript_9728/g.23480 Transcript_9728/m.23480 type:complete len:81 (+) Transcript_9728:1-243(+)
MKSSLYTSPQETAIERMLFAIIPTTQSQQMVIDPRLSGPVDLGYPCKNIWCMSDAQTDPRTGHPAPAPYDSQYPAFTYHL